MRFVAELWPALCIAAENYPPSDSTRLRDYRVFFLGAAIVAQAPPPRRVDMNNRLSVYAYLRRAYRRAPRRATRDRNPKKWGKYFWCVLHVAGEVLKPGPPLAKFLRASAGVLPCRACGKAFRRLLDRVPAKKGPDYVIGLRNAVAGHASGNPRTFALFPGGEAPLDYLRRGKMIVAW
jgi:hypothetical protein